MRTKRSKNTKRRNENTFFSLLKKAIKDTIDNYRKEKAERLRKHELLSSKSDWSMIETFIQRINENPNLKCFITLNDGTRIELGCIRTRQKKDYEMLDLDIKE